jgi:exopolysaccharide production protein ExoQ
VPAVFLILQGDSATALVTMVALAGVFVLLAIAAVLGSGGRLFALVAAGLLAIPTILALPVIQAEVARFQTDVLEKDARLTGRTLLWEEADRLIVQAPVIGHGYKAIWLGPKGKGLLARNNQKDGRAFHFHDTFRELLADLGIVGLGLFLLPLGHAAVRGVLLLIAAVDAQRAFAMATLFTILLRMRTELVVAPFMIDTVMITAIVAALAAMPLGLGAGEPRPARRLRLKPAPVRARTPAPVRSTRRPSSHPQRNPA